MNKPRWRWLTDLRFKRREDGEGEPVVSWSGNQDAAALIANDHLKKAVALGGDIPRGVGMHWGVFRAHRRPVFRV